MFHAPIWSVLISTLTQEPWNFSMDVVPLSIYTIVTACDQSVAVIVGKT
jgi:hypothetical protein